MIGRGSEVVARASILVAGHGLGILQDHSA